MDRSAPNRMEAVDAQATWHLYWQAALGRELFAHPSLFSRVRERVLDAHRRRGLVLVDYLLMPGEIHVVSVLPSDTTPGDLARAVGNIVARWVREAQPVRSPVFAGPFRAHRLASEHELRCEVRLLAWRPVLAGLCSTPSHYPHGALRIALGLTRSQGFDARPVLGHFGTTVQEARAALRAWVARRPAVREVHEWGLVRGLAMAVGSVGPQIGMARVVRGAPAAILVAAGGANGVDGALKLLESWVGTRLGVPGRVDLRNARDGLAARGRALVACLAVEHGLCSAASVARHFGRAKATLSEQMAACRARPADRQALQVPVARIVEEAVGLSERKERLPCRPRMKP